MGKEKKFFNLSTTAIIFAKTSKLLNRKNMENFPYFLLHFCLPLTKRELIYIEKATVLR